MNTRRTLLFLSMLLFALLCFGCTKHKRDEEAGSKNITGSPKETGDGNDPKSANADSVTLSPEDLPQPDTDYVTNEMYQNAILAEGNLGRLAAAMRKAENGEEITVGVIGGSITQGSLASSTDKCYASRFCKWWTKAFPKAKINFINAGIGATTSYLGVHRVDKDLLSYQPDVVIVEFSVNDSNTLFYKETYEDLVRRILKADNKPAVLLFFMVMEDGTSAQTNDLLIGFKYDLPRISYGQMVYKAIQAGTFTWDEISPDNIHPNDKGHAMIGEILWRFLNSVYAKLNQITDKAEPLSAKPFFTEAYTDAAILDSSSITPVKLGSFKESSVNDRFTHDWTTTSGRDSIVFETEAQNIGIMYLKTTDGKSGQYDVYVDGTFCQTLDADFSGGWGNYPETTEVYRSTQKKMHKIEIKKHADSNGSVFSVLGLLIS